MTKLAPEWVQTSDPVIRSPARYRWTTAPASCLSVRSQDLCLGLIAIYLVFLAFNESLLAQNHVCILFMSLLRPRRGLRGIVFTRSVCVSVCLCVCVCVSVCPANILLFYCSATRRDIDLKLIQDTYRVVLDPLKKLTFIGKRSRSQGRYIAF